MRARMSHFPRSRLYLLVTPLREEGNPSLHPLRASYSLARRVLGELPANTEVTIPVASYSVYSQEQLIVVQEPESNAEREVSG